MKMLPFLMVRRTWTHVYWTWCHFCMRSIFDKTHESSNIPDDVKKAAVVSRRGISCEIILGSSFGAGHPLYLKPSDNCVSSYEVSTSNMMTSMRYWTLLTLVVAIEAVALMPDNAGEWHTNIYVLLIWRLFESAQTSCWIWVWNLFVIN